MELALQSLLGVLAIPLFVFAMSEDRGSLKGGSGLRVVAIGLAFQFAIAVVLLRLPGSKAIFDLVSSGVAALQGATQEGMRLVFGFLAGGPAPFEVAHPQSQFILAIHALPLILVISALARLLYHWGVLQRVVGLFAKLLQRSFGIGGPLGTVAAAKIFIGMVEAPLLVRPYESSASHQITLPFGACSFSSMGHFAPRVTHDTKSSRAWDAGHCLQPWPSAWQRLPAR